MTQALDFVFETISDTWVWLSSWNFQGVSFAVFLVGFTLLSILIARIFN